jgi:multiple sugar transport system permease protein
MAVQAGGATASLPIRAMAPGGVTGPKRHRLRVAHGRAGLMMTGPFLALFAVFFAGPLIYSIVLSLRSPLTGAYSGLLNYRSAFSDPSFWSAIVRMGYFGLIQVTVMIGLAIVLALLLDSPYCRGRKVFALVYFLPYAVPGVIAAIMWGFLLQPDLDSALGLPHWLGLTSGPIQPLSYRLALYAIMLIVTWEWTGYNMTILLTSLTNVPHQVLEAAKVDGASELSIATRIKLPLVRRTIIFTVVLSIIGTLQLFNEPVILNEIATTGNSLTPNQIIYNTAFVFGNEQLAAAQSVILAAITIVATVAFYGIVRRRMNPLAAPRATRAVAR